MPQNGISRATRATSIGYVAPQPLALRRVLALDVLCGNVPVFLITGTISVAPDATIGQLLRRRLFFHGVKEFGHPAMREATAMAILRRTEEEVRYGHAPRRGDP